MVILLDKNIKLTTVEGERVELIGPLHVGVHCNVYKVKYNGEYFILKWKENDDYKIGSFYYETIKSFIKHLNLIRNYWFHR